MEYVQMTLDDWTQMKQKLRQELIGVKQSFVRIGYALRQIDDQRLYENDGYKSIAEFAKAEYGLEASTTSRFMSINREYSIDGYSEHLRPEYTDLGRSQLEEMLKLPDSDRQMIQPEASREDIRELKRFNKTEPAAGVADDISQLIEKFFEDNKDSLSLDGAPNSGQYTNISATALYCTGSKHRVVRTQDYGERLLCCYETPSPMFGDVGAAQTDETGKCLIFIDEKFAQTIDLEYLYDVFLTKYGPGDCYVSERTPSYFVVKGTKNLKFAWEVKTIQRDYENLRLEAHTREKDDTDYIYDVSAYMNTLLYQLD